MDLVLFPDSRLRQKCEPVAEVTDSVRQTLSTMSKRMIEWNGIGLAAPQCGIMKRMFVAAVSGRACAFVNPKVEDLHEGTAAMSEGCLSMPGLAVELERPASVLVRAQDERGKNFEMKCRGILARCVQHEVDHLDGILMVDHLEQLPHRFAMQALWDARFRGR